MHKDDLFFKQQDSDPDVQVLWYSALWNFFFNHFFLSFVFISAEVFFIFFKPNGSTIHLCLTSYISLLSSTPPQTHSLFFLTEFAHFVPCRVILALAVAHSTFPLFSPALLCHDPSVMLLRRAQTSTVQLIFSHPSSAEIGWVPLFRHKPEHSE